MITKKIELVDHITGKLYEMFITYNDRYHPETIQIVIISPDDRVIRIDNITKNAFLKLTDDLKRLAKEIIGEDMMTEDQSEV